MQFSSCSLQPARMLPYAGHPCMLMPGRGILRPGRPYRPDWSQGAFIRKLFRRANSSEMGDPVGENTQLGDGKVGGDVVDLEGKDLGMIDGLKENAIDVKEDLEKLTEEEKSDESDESEEWEKSEESEESEGLEGSEEVIKLVGSEETEEVKEDGNGDEDKEKDPFGLEELFKEVTAPQQLGKRGEGWVIAQFFSLLLILFPPLNLTGLSAAVGWVSLAAGLAFIASGVLALGRSLSPLPYPRESATLVTEGVYALVRHPLYGGLIIGSLGLAFITGSEVRGLLTLLLWWILESKIKIEEKALEDRFPDYAEYKVGVKKFFPFVY